MDELRISVALRPPLKHVSLLRAVDPLRATKSFDRADEATGLKSRRYSMWLPALLQPLDRRQRRDYDEQRDGRGQHVSA